MSEDERRDYVNYLKYKQKITNIGKDINELRIKWGEQKETSKNLKREWQDLGEELEKAYKKLKVINRLAEEVVEKQEELEKELEKF